MSYNFALLSVETQCTLGALLKFIVLNELASFSLRLKSDTCRNYGEGYAIVKIRYVTMACFQ